MSPRHIGVYFVVRACHLCYPDGAGFPGCSGSPQEGPPVPGQNCKLSRPSVTLPNERRWNFPSRSLGARPSFLMALHEAGNLQCSSPGDRPAHAALPLLSGGTQRRYELDRRALTVNPVAVHIKTLRVQRLTRPSTSPRSIQSRKQKRNETERRWSKAVTEFCGRHYGHTQVCGHDLLCNLGKNPLTSLNLCSLCIQWE